MQSRADGDRRGGPNHPGRVNVGVVGQILYSGGAEQWTLQLARYCDPARVTWTGFAFVYGGHVNEAMEAALTTFAPCRFGPEAIHDLCARSDVILVWGVPDGFNRGVLPRRAARRCRIILTSHGDAKIDYTREVLREPDEADLIVGVTPAAVGCVPEEARPRTRVIGNMADPARVVDSADLSREDVHARWGVPQGRRVLGFLGRKSPEKRPDRLPDAIRALHDRGETDWVGVHVGEGFAADELHRHALAVSGDSVLFPGVEWDVANVFRGFDWLLMPSYTEGSALAVLEAMLAGVPVLSTPVGSSLDFPDLVRMLPADPSGDDIATALLSDLADPAATSARVARARRLVREFASPERFGREWTEAICDAAEASPPPQSEPPAHHPSLS
jgi:glycosyltransferase involved in cell wall biosynthesis